MNHSSMHAKPTFPGTGVAKNVRRGFALLICALMVMSTLAMPVTAQDEEEPQPTQDPALVESDPLAPQDNDDEQDEPAETPVAQPTPEEVDEDEDTAAEEDETGPQVTGAAQRADDAAGPGYPAVLAHGLVYVTGDDVVWQVREVIVDPSGDTGPTVSDAAVLLGQSGSVVIRNDVTGKRAKVDPGEGYFRAAGDGYTVMAEGGDPILWHFELVDPDDVALDAFYESPTIGALNEGVYDMMMTRYVLPPGESVELPGHSGAAMVMVASGEVEIDANGDRSALLDGEGQSLEGNATASNTANSDVVFVYVYLGDEVDDSTAAAPQAPAAETDDEAAVETDTTTEDVDTTGEETTEPVAATSDDAGAFLTSIDVTADAEIYLTITVDGLTVFDGTLPAGASSGPVVGTTFEVYTSSGINTNFTNACGDYFQMGFEEGEAWYSLAATADSCAP